jgi:hypothetical protein
MRSTILNWLVEVHRHFDLSDESIALTVDLLDRFRDATPVSMKPSKLQLVGCACLWISSKYEDVNPPTSHQLSTIASNSFTVKDLVEVEAFVLNTVHFKLVVNLPVHFANRCFHLMAPEAVWMTKYLLELEMQSGLRTGADPEEIAVATILLSVFAVHGERPDFASGELGQRLLSGNLFPGVSALELHRKTLEVLNSAFHAVPTASATVKRYSPLSDLGRLEGW